MPAAAPEPSASVPATAGPRRGRPGYDQQTVLNVAVDVFNRHGYEATSMGILAENLGITKSAIYHHVPSKGDLLRLRGNTDVERLALARRREFDHRVADLVDAARQEGSVRSDIDPRTTTRLLFGTINSIVEWYKPGGPLPAQKLADNVITMVFDGLHTRRD